MGKDAPKDSPPQSDLRTLPLELDRKGVTMATHDKGWGGLCFYENQSLRVR